jgi:hypothetical protein
MKETAEVVVSSDSVPAWKRISMIQFSSIVMVLSLIAAIITYQFATPQIQEAKKDRIIEILEQVSNFEERVESTVKEINVISISDQTGTLSIPPGNNIKDMKSSFNQSETLKVHLLNLLDENKLLLGEEIYNKIKDYIETTYEYYLIVQSGKATEEQKRTRAQTRISLSQI